MNILLAAHAPWKPTGYGMPVELIAAMWRKLGHNTAVLAIDHQGPGIMDYHGLQVALSSRQRWGQDVIADLVEYFASDLVVSFFDPWVLDEPGFGRELTGCPWIAWLPVDQEPLAKGLPEILRYADLALSFSDYGEDALRRANIKDKASRMPIPIDVDAFTPADATTKEKARAIFGLSMDPIVVGLVASNLPGDRKAIAEQVEGFCMFARAIGINNARLLMNIGREFVDVPRMLLNFGCGDCALYLSEFTRDYGLSRHADLVHLYRAFDVLLHASAAEGFGMCMLEAMACGVPVIYNDTTSMPELANGMGFPVEDHVRALAPQQGWWFRPTPSGVTNALMDFWTAYREKTLPAPQKLRQAADQYSIDALAPRWKAVLDGFAA